MMRIRAASNYTVRAGFRQLPSRLVAARLSRAVISIGNQEFGIPRKYQYQIGIWYLCPKFLGIFFVFYRYLECGLVKIWFNIGIFRQNKNRFGIWFLWLPFHWFRFIIFLKLASLLQCLR